jgi:predicted ATPase
MKLNKIKIIGYKSIEHLELNLDHLNILIGANGSGKTNFISIFKLLNQMIEGRFQLAVGKGGGASSFLHYGPKRTKKIEVELQFGQNGYSCEWEPTKDDTLIFGKEVTEFYGHGRNSTPYYDIGVSGHKESAVLELAQDKEHKVTKHTLEGLRSWRVYHFHDTSDEAPMKLRCQINDNEYLRYNASNLAAFLYLLKKMYEPHYLQIRDTIRLAAPFFDDFILRPISDNPTMIQLEWKEKNSDFPFLAHHLSDGTLRFICLTTVLLQPKHPDMILIDEPELGLHPYAINVLASLIKSASHRTQIIVSTQSVPLISLFEPNDLLVVNREGGKTTIERCNQEKLKDWLEDYSLGQLWEMNLLGGRPSR